MVIKKNKKTKSVSRAKKKITKEPTVSKAKARKKLKPKAKIKEKAKVTKKISRRPKLKGKALTRKVRPSKHIETKLFTSRTEVKQRPSAIKPHILKEPLLKEKIKPEVKAGKIIEINIPITAKDLSVKLQQKPSILIKRLLDVGILTTLNNPLGKDAIEKLKKEFNFEIKELPSEEESVISIHKQPDDPKLLKLRPPVVTLMGHVDHGKTSLLDAIRKTNLIDKEYGGITQHIGAYEVAFEKGKITFLDTPGHEAFTAMRARGAKITDLVILVVAADDGVMPQTIEAIDHARAADVPIVVAINKIDKPNADIDKVMGQLSKLDLMPEEWGGKVITVGVSAKTGEGVDKLLEMILLEAEMLELKANYSKKARGVVIESKLSKGRGPVATFLVQNGTLRINDIVLVGQYFGKIRAMFDEHSKQKISAGPSVPIEVLGLSGTPQAGEEFYVVDDEKKARDISLKRQEERKLKEIAPKKLTLEELSNMIKEGRKIEELKIILKADVQGSLEAAVQTLNKLPTQEVKLNIIHTGVGLINTSDVLLASVSEALVFGFHVQADDTAKEKANIEGVQIRTYNVIYELVNDLKGALEGLLKPRLKKIFLGRAEVKQVFRLSKAGIIAGCMVQKGKIMRSCDVCLIRNQQTIFEGKISSLKRFKNDVKEVTDGMECGISLGEFQDIREKDIIDAYSIEKIARKL